MPSGIKHNRGVLLYLWAETEAVSFLKSDLKKKLNNNNDYYFI